jgi:hypothetical protein
MVPPVPAKLSPIRKGNKKNRAMTLRIKGFMVRY